MSRSRWRTDPKLLGATMLKDEAEIVIQIGNNALTKQEVATVLRHTHVGSVRKLAKFVEGRRFKSFHEAIRHVTLEDISAKKGYGDVTVYAWMTLVEYYGRDPLKWLDWEGKGTLATLQHRIRHPRNGRKK